MLKLFLNWFFLLLWFFGLWFFINWLRFSYCWFSYWVIIVISWLIIKIVRKSCLFFFTFWNLFFWFIWWGRLNISAYRWSIYFFSWQLLLIFRGRIKFSWGRIDFYFNIIIVWINVLWATCFKNSIWTWYKLLLISTKINNSRLRTLRSNLRIW